MDYDADLGSGSMIVFGKIGGLRKSRYEGTNRGTKGTVVNQTLLLLPRFPYKNIILSRYLDFRIINNSKIEVQTA